ncbi:thiamine phosphate synthase [Arabiibacter massiliensis]|uniref:thiamine phosphate synthase n=1 Tax=Arabiibacter massiliensis TaxID=1870985 RepID=UPI0009BA75F5|nr:thiamine phosphate synthase [Arabiibacter massiliensis]
MCSCEGARGRFWRVFVTDRRACARPLPDQVALLAAQGLIDAVILREKDLDEAAYARLAAEVADACAAAGIAFAVHTHAAVARRLGARAVHLPLPQLRAQGRPEGFAAVLASVHSLEEAAEARALGADVLVASPVFAPSCKPGVAGRGPAFLRAIVEAAGAPVLALGGITDATEPLARACGAAGACRMADFARR